MDEEIIEQTTKELNRFLKPCLGRLNYGNLRKTPEFPVREESIEWVVGYETARRSTTIANILYNIQNDSWEVVGDLVPDRESALNCFKERVEAIPETRRKRIGEWIDRGATIEKLCEGYELSKVYTKEEIEFIHSLIETRFLKDYNLHTIVGKAVNFDGEPSVIGYRPRDNPRDVKFWGNPQPEDIAEYVITVGSKVSARMVTLTSENINKLKI